MHAGITRAEYIEKLNGLLNRGYRKNDPEMFDLLYTRMPQAIQHAKRLLDTMDGKPPADANPSTTVHLLVEALREFER